MIKNNTKHKPKQNLIINKINKLKFVQCIIKNKQTTQNIKTIN
jgi:hypothetical protein